MSINFGVKAMNIGEKVREIRVNNGTKAVYVSEKTGIPPKTLSAIERGQQMPTIPQLVKLADFFDVTLDELVRN